MESKVFFGPPFYSRGKYWTRSDLIFDPISYLIHSVDQIDINPFNINNNNEL